MRNQGRKHLFAFEADAGAGEGSAGAGDAGAGDAGAAGAGDGGGAAERTFTPADVERIVKERLARAKTTPPEDYEDLKAKAARLAEIEESNKTELEKERDRAAKAEERANKIEAEAKETRLRAAIIAEAAKPGRNVVDTNDVIALLDRSTLTLDDQGVPTNIAEAMDSLLKAKPHLVASDGGSRGDADQGARNGGGVTQLTAADVDRMSPEEVLKAEKEGRLHNLMTGAKS